MRILSVCLQYVFSFVTCEIVSEEILRESVDYLVMALLILGVRWSAGKVEKLIESLKKK